MLKQPSQEGVDPGQKLFKLGRRTGFTIGRHSGLLSVHLGSSFLENGDGNKVLTYEHTVYHDLTGRMFSDMGDSGAVVFNNANQAVGLIFAGKDESTATYFTPWEALVKDIKRMTEAVEIRVSLRGLMTSYQTDETLAPRP